MCGYVFYVQTTTKEERVEGLTLLVFSLIRVSFSSSLAPRPGL